MVQFIFVVAVVNFLLGYALCVYLERRAVARMAGATARRFTLAPPPARADLRAAPFPTPATAAVPSKDEAASLEEIPAEWLEQLQGEAIVANSFIEASVQVLRLEVGKYRERLIVLDEAVREAFAAENPAELAALVARTRETNEDWLQRQREAVEHLQARKENLGPFAPMGGSLEDILLEQAAQIETTLSNFDLLDWVSDPAAGAQRLLLELSRLVDLAHALRDRMHESLLTIMAAERRLDAIDRRMLFDPLTGLHNRTGLEVLFHDWLRDDPSRQRLVSVALLDLDRFGQINERFGPRAGDRLLAGFGQFLRELLRKDRGMDVPVRFAGETFAVFFGDTGPRGATSAVERMRQSAAAATFEYQEAPLELNVSCAVTEVGKKELPQEVCLRLFALLGEAKRRGRNRTMLDEGGGPQEVDPPQFQVKARVVQIRDE